MFTLASLENKTDCIKNKKTCFCVSKSKTCNKLSRKQRQECLIAVLWKSMPANVKIKSFNQKRHLTPFIKFQFD